MILWDHFHFVVYEWCCVFAFVFLSPYLIKVSTGIVMDEITLYLGLI